MSDVETENLKLEKLDPRRAHDPELARSLNRNWDNLDQSLSDFLLAGVNTIFASGINDLPPISGGVYTIPSGTVLFLEQIIDLGSDRLELLEGSRVLGFGGQVAGLTSSNLLSTVFATSTIGLLPAAFSDIRIENTSVNNIAVAFDNALDIVSLTRVALLGDIQAGNFRALNMIEMLVIDRLIEFTTTSTGLFTVRDSGFLQTGATNAFQINNGVTIGTMEFINASFSLINAGGVGINLIGTGTVSSGLMIRGAVLGAGSLTLGFDQTTDEWEILGVDGFTTSSDQGVSDFNNVVAGTINITVTDQWEDISDSGVNIIYVLQPGDEKFNTLDANTGRVRYGGVLSRAYNISGVVLARATGGGGIDIEIGISVNNADPDAKSIVRTTISNSVSSSVTIPGVPINLVTNDTIKLKTRNVTPASTTNIDINQSKLAISK